MLIAGKDFEFFNPYKEVNRTRASLPHWTQPKALYFVTFRLADSIPAEKLNDWRINYENWLRARAFPEIIGTLAGSIFVLSKAVGREAVREPCSPD